MGKKESSTVSAVTERQRTVRPENQPGLGSMKALVTMTSTVLDGAIGMEVV